MCQKLKKHVIARKNDEAICCYSNRLPPVRSLTLSCFAIARNDELKAGLLIHSLNLF